jgi:hypothetical protein
MASFQHEIVCIIPAFHSIGRASLTYTDADYGCRTLIGYEGSRGKSCRTSGVSMNLVASHTIQNCTCHWLSGDQTATTSYEASLTGTAVKNFTTACSPALKVLAIQHDGGNDRYCQHQICNGGCANALLMVGRSTLATVFANRLEPRGR